MRSRSYQRRNACTLVSFTASPGRLTSGACGLCDKSRHVLRVGAAVDLRRHLPVALRTALVDGVQHERIRGLQVVQVRADPRDGVGRLERVAEAAAAPEQLLAM